MIYLVTNNSSIHFDFNIISVEESISMLQKCSILQYDSETTGLNPQNNHLTYIQFGNDKEDFRIVVDAETVDILQYKDILESKYLLGHNLKFDLQYLYNHGITPMKIIDTFIIEKTIYLGYPDGILSYALSSVVSRRVDAFLEKNIRSVITTQYKTKAAIEYAANDVYYLEKVFESQKKDCVQKDLLKAIKIECDFIPVVAYTDWCGIKLDVKKWKEKMAADSAGLTSSLKALDQFVIAKSKTDPRFLPFVYTYAQPDLFEEVDLGDRCKINWSSSKQVIKVAQLLGFNTLTTDKKTGEIKDTVLEKHLKTQKGVCDEFIKLYFDYQGFSKVVSSFGQNFLDSIHPATGRIHTNFKPIGATSGRMSCGGGENEELTSIKRLRGKRKAIYPNLQQLPHDPLTRECFIAEEGNMFCSSDFAALESRLGADIYNEEAMIREYLEGSGDMHSLAAVACFPEELAGVSVKDVKKLRPDLRNKAKAPEFAIQFGGGAKSISESLAITVEEAQTIYDNFMNAFSGLKRFKAWGEKEVQRLGYIVMCKDTGHKMFWHDHKQWLETKETFTPEFWEEYRKLKVSNPEHYIVQKVRKHFSTASAWGRLALNSVTQGSGIICTKTACTMLYRWIIENGYFGKVKIVAIVHDEIDVEFPEELKDFFPKFIEETMEKAAALYCHKLPIPAEAAVGKYWIH